MRFKVSTVTPLASVPLVFELAEAKAHLRVEHGEDDALIEGFIRAAQGAVEAFTGQVLTVREMRWTAAGFPSLPDPLRLWRAPVTAIASVQHLAADGAVTTLDAADWRWSELAADELMPAIGGDWPALAASDLGAAAVRVNFTAGYEEGLCPSDLSAAVKLTMAWMYANRDAPGGLAEALPPGAMALAGPYRRIVI